MPDSIVNFRDLPTVAAERLERLVCRFAQAWQHGATPSLDDYLHAEPRERLALLIELVHTDLECRLKAGQPARVEEYLARFPELAEKRRVAITLVTREYELRRRSEPALGSLNTCAASPITERNWRLSSRPWRLRAPS
jgi:hypothetical protein